MKIKWKFEVGNPKDLYGVKSSAKVSNGSVYFGSGYDNHLYALDVNTGKEKWKFKTGDSIWSSPSISDGIVYFGCDDKHLYALDAKTGEEQWSFETGKSISLTPTISNGIVYIGSSDKDEYYLEGNVKHRTHYLYALESI